MIKKKNFKLKTYFILLNKMSDRQGYSIFEKTKLISMRAEALVNNAQTTLPKHIKLPSSCIEIAYMEYKMGLIPLVVKRKMPNGKIEIK
jgi:DNA-directed RNA polymerase subunit K/omega